jgi:hypothetical protein
MDFRRVQIIGYHEEPGTQKLSPESINLEILLGNSKQLS